MRLIAHRGYSFIAPENTLVAFDRALSCGAKAVECDLQRTRDGHLIVFHDGTLNRTTNGRGAVKSKRLDEVLQLSAGYTKKFGSTFSNERIITFDTLLQRLQGHAHLYAEIKRQAVTRDGHERREMLRRVRELQLISAVTFISFEWSAIETMRALDPEVQLGLLFDRFHPKKMFEVTERMAASILLGRADLVERHPEFIHESHKRGIQVGVYTVDSLARLKRLEKLGVDAAATNRIGDFILEFEIHPTGVPPLNSSVS